MFPETPRDVLILSREMAAFVSQALLTGLAVAAVLLCASAVFQITPWLSFPLALQSSEPVEAGKWVQLGLTLFLIALVTFLPASRRVMALEQSHRRFHASMEDVARAYHAAHAADRSGVFRFQNEFDAVRERLVFLRNHPDLSHFEPEILELAGQMSHVSRDLATTYSDERVEEARNTLARRQAQAARIEDESVRVRRALSEIEAWVGQVEHEEERAHAALEALRAEISDTLPRLGLYLIDDGSPFDRASRSSRASSKSKEAVLETHSVRGLAAE